MPNRMPKLFWKWLVCLLRTSTVTSDFNQPRKEYINCISSDLSAEMMSTQNDDQNSGWSRGLRSWIKLVPIQIHISPVNTPGKADCLMNWRFSATLVFLAFIWERVFTCIYSYSRNNLSRWKTSKGHLRSYSRLETYQSWKTFIIFWLNN